MKLPKTTADALDTLEWFFSYDGREIPNRFTPFILGGKYQRAQSNGISQFHPLLLKPNEAATISVPDTTIRLSEAGSQIVFRIADHVNMGAETDSVRYDLKYATGDYIPKGVLDREEGIFKLNTANIIPWTYLLKAYVSDGKGGTDSSFFTAKIEN